MGTKEDAGHVKVAISSLLVQRWKIIVIKPKLHVTNFAAGLERSQEGNINIKWCNWLDWGYLTWETTFADLTVYESSF